MAEEPVVPPLAAPPPPPQGGGMMMATPSMDILEVVEPTKEMKAEVRIEEFHWSLDWLK